MSPPVPPVRSLRPVAGPQRRLAGVEDLVSALGIAFSDQQLAAITAPLEPGVIIAGAGSGKTTVMAARVVWLVGTGQVRPEQVLGLTFTRKAAAELSGRVRDALQRAGVVTDQGPDESGEQLVMTYDAFAARLVAEHGLRIGVETDPTMISGATRYRLASRVVAAAAGPFDFISRLRPATITERVLRLDADLQQHLVDPADLDAHTRDHLLELESAPTNNRGNVYADLKRAIVAASERLELASLVQDYQALKRRLGLVEFADQMAIAARLAAEVPAVSTALRDAFRVVLLDEYQDTSAAQAVMLHGLFGGTTPSQGLGHPVTAVGDPFQAIYGWRGAAASNILEFAETFRTVRGQRATSYALTVNRRSGPSILEVANNLSRPLRVQAGSQSGLPGLGLLQAPDGTAAGTVRGATFATWGEEVAWVADQVVAARTAGAAPRWAEIAVLTRRNADIGPLYGELTARDVPVEIVGLGGLLALPEVMDVTALLRVVDDVTANPDLVRILTGPRWRIGPRDLALLGRRARELARAGVGTTDEDGVPDGLLRALEEAVADVDPTDVVSLLDALESPGDLDYSDAATGRFRQLAGELRYLRQHAGEPVLDLTRRVVGLVGLDVELMATPDFRRTHRRDQLGAFLDAVADYVDVDGDASLAGLLAYLQAEIETGAGLEQVVPSDREAVKLLTVHRAKGLEWDVVLLPALVKGVFPSDRVTDNWVTNPAVLPADLRGDAASIPQLVEATNAALTAYKRELSEQQGFAEDRLAYVAATRARQLLVVSGHTWRPDLTNPRVLSTYLQTALVEAERQDEVAAVAPPAGPENPLIAGSAPSEWPAPLDPDALERRRQAATAVHEARVRQRTSGRYEDPAAAQLLLDGEEVVAGWDDDIERLLVEATEARSGRVGVELPGSLSASALMRLREDPQAYAAELARPMPRPPSRAARFGTRFHAWVERWFAGSVSTTGLGQQALIDPDDLVDAADDDGMQAAEDTELRVLCDAFAAGRYGDRVPYAIESPFSLLLDGRIVRGRIDAVYALDGERGDGEGGAYAYQVVDWKTRHREDANPLQLAIYRQAWAEVCGVPVEQIDAVFYYVRSDRVVRPTDLPDRAALVALLSGAGVPAGHGSDLG